MKMNIKSSSYLKYSELYLATTYVIQITTQLYTDLMSDQCSLIKPMERQDTE